LPGDRCVFESPNCVKCVCSRGSVSDGSEEAYSSLRSPGWIWWGRLEGDGNGMKKEEMEAQGKREGA